MKIANVSTGFSEIPGQISLNFYAQGCKLACSGCQNPKLLSFEGGIDLTNDDFEDILKSRELPTWVCWLGGDATFQPEEFKEANAFFKNKGYKICLYTGRFFCDVKELLDDVDLVIDGPWEGIGIEEENTNQKVYFKTNNVWNEVKFSDLKEMLTLW